MNKILVPLKKDDRIEEIVPYIEKVAQQGTERCLPCPSSGDRF